MARKRTRALSRRRRTPYRASPLCRHRIRVRWLLAQRTRLRNYLRSFGDTDSANGDISAESSDRPD